MLYEEKKSIDHSCIRTKDLHVRVLFANRMLHVVIYISCNCIIYCNFVCNHLCSVLIDEFNIIVIRCVFLMVLIPGIFICTMY